MVIQNVVRPCKEKQDLSEINLKSATALDLNKCLKQVELPISIHRCTPISELPISTLVSNYSAR